MNEDRKTYYSQHPVPQHVLGVEFKLVGGMTIKQFAYAAGGIVLAYLLYSTAVLPLVFSVPLGIATAVLGLSLAFIPVNDRPLDDYLKNFLLAVASPTERFWIKEPANLDIFYESFKTREVHETGFTKDKKNLKEYIEKMKPQGARSALDIREEEYLKSIYAEFEAEGLNPNPKIKPEVSGVKAAAFSPERVEVKPTSTLASEVNFSQGNIISLPTTGKTKRFVTTIKNTKAGRKLHALPTVAGEIILPVAGEIVLKTTGEETSVPQSQRLMAAAEEMVSDLTEKIEEIKSTAKENEPPPEKIETPSQPPVDKTPPFPPPETPLKTEAVSGLAPPAPEGPKEPITPALPKPPAPPESIILPEPVPAPIMPPSPGSAPIPAPTPEMGKTVGRIAGLSEELEKLKSQNLNLLLEIEKQKQLRQEAEILADESKHYQEKIRYFKEQNERLENEKKRTEEDLKKFREKSTRSEREKEYIQKNLKDYQQRLEAIAREKAESIDETVRLQKEMQEMRIKAQRMAQEGFSQSLKKEPPGFSEPARPGQKPIPFIKDVPNVINGYVKDKGNLLIKNAVIIVKDQNGDVVRALKTNDLGQFAITTPLPNGLYHIEASAANLTFDIMTIDLVGTVLEPIEFVGR